MGAGGNSLFNVHRQGGGEGLRVWLSIHDEKQWWEDEERRVPCDFLATTLHKTYSLRIAPL
jgi:hypothetical protein